MMKTLSLLFAFILLSCNGQESKMKMKKENPLRTAPDNKASSQPLDDDSFYYPVKITGNWLMVQDDHEQNFWIKWCDEKGRLILELYYDA